VYEALSLGLIMVTFFLGSFPAPRVPQQEDADTRAKARNFLKEATELASEIKSPTDRSIVLVRIGEISWRAGDKATATESFDSALKIVNTRAEENLDQDPREHTRASIAIARARAGDVDGAQRTVSLIEDDSEKAFALSQIALAQARAKNFADAVHTASALNDPDLRDQSFAWIANVQARAGDPLGAAQLAHSIKNAQYRAQSLAYIADLTANGGHAGEARSAVQEALRAAEQAEPREGGAGRSSLAACASDEPEPPRDAALESVALTQARTGDTAGALETINRMHDKSGRENMLATVAEYQARAGDFAGARASIAAISRDACKTAALHGVAVAQFEAGDLSAALLTVNDMTDPAQKAGTLTYLGRLVADQGSFNSAMGILARARVIASQLTDRQQRVDVLEVIARIQAQAGSRYEAAKTLAEAVPDAIAADEQAKRDHAWSSVLPDLIELQAEMGDLDGASANLVHVDDNDRTFILQKAARALSKVGDMQGASAWAARQVSPRDKALALIGVAEGLLEKPEIEKK